MKERNSKKNKALLEYKKLVEKCKRHIPLFTLCTILNGFAFFLIFSSVGVLLSQILAATMGNYEQEMMYKMIYYLMIVIIFSISAGFSAIGFVKIEEDVQSDLRIEMMNGYFHTSEHIAERYSQTEVMNRMNYDLQETAKLIGNYISGWVFQPILSGILSIAWLFFVNWSVALLCIGCSAINMIIMYFAADRLRNLNLAMTRERSGVLEFLQECVDGAEEIRIFHLLPLFLNKLEEKLKHTEEVTTQYRKLEGMRWSVMSFFADCISVIALLVLGALLASFGTISFPEIMIGLPLVGQIGEGMIAMSNFFVIVKQIGPNVERVFEIIELDPEEKTNYSLDNNNMHNVCGDLDFENVKFSYGEKVILNNVSFKVRPGEKVAFVGESGIGKSTIAKLLLGLYSPESGLISYGKEKQSEMPISEWRSFFSYLPQDGYLFHETIEENISLGNGEKQNKRSISLAAEKAFATDFILDSPQGYQSMSGEGNSGFSGGQIQRICMARALFREAPVLLLDEPTSSLDVQSEERIRETLNQITDDRMVIVITHRLNLTVDFDRIYVLENGMISESGSHTQLLQKNGKYKKLWENYKYLSSREEKSTCYEMK